MTLFTRPPFAADSLVHRGLRHKARAGLGVAVAALIAGCASAPPTASHFNPMPAGSTHSYWRAATGSYGSGEGRIDWVLGEGEWQGQRMLFNRSPQAGTTVYDPKTHAMVAQLNGAGQAVTTWSPPIGPRWPMVVGDHWTTQHTVALPAAGRSLQVQVDWRIEAQEHITVRAGRFDTWRVVSTDSLGEVQRVWMSPPQGLGVVKRELVRPASHPAGAGTLVGELIEVQRAAAPGR